jgi:hypothetical protein
MSTLPSRERPPQVLKRDKGVTRNTRSVQKRRYKEVTNYGTGYTLTESDQS